MTALHEPQRPYRVKDAAQLLGVSEDTIARGFAELGGAKVKGTILIPRHRVDALVYGPDAGKPPVERVLETLPVLSFEDRVKVARAALAVGQEGAPTA